MNSPGNSRMAWLGQGGMAGRAASYAPRSLTEPGTSSPHTAHRRWLPPAEDGGAALRLVLVRGGGKAGSWMVSIPVQTEPRVLCLHSPGRLVGGVGVGSGGDGRHTHSAAVPDPLLHVQVHPLVTEFTR